MYGEGIISCQKLYDETGGNSGRRFASFPLEVCPIDGTMWYILCTSFVVHPPFLLAITPVCLVLMPDAIRTYHHTQDRSSKCHPISLAITFSTLETFSISVFVDDGLTIVYLAVEDVENVPRDDGRQAHGTPVL